MNDSPTPRPRISKLGTLLTLWLAFSILAALSGLTARSPLPLPLVALLFAAAAISLLRTATRLRLEVRSIGIRPLIAFHLLRIAAGGYFLLLHAAGSLPAEFAIQAGIGDILVGIGAAGILMGPARLRNTSDRKVVLAWNLLGLLDILLVLGNGARLFIADPAAGAAFGALPLALLPTFVVPLVIVSHLLIFRWYGSSRERPALAGARSSG